VLSWCALRRIFRCRLLYEIGGLLDTGVLDEVAWWQTDDFWQYALYAAVASIRVAAERASVPVRACRVLLQPVADGADGRRNTVK
jgi:hypothetical protein